jgi:hypothetical protein
VDTVMVNGRVVVEAGQLAGVDVPALAARADAISRALLERASRATGRDYFARP